MRRRSDELVTTAAPRFFNGLPNRALFEDWAVAVTLRCTSQALDNVGDIDQTLFDKWMLLNHIPGLRSWHLPAFGLAA